MRDNDLKSRKYEGVTKLFLEGTFGGLVRIDCISWII